MTKEAYKGSERRKHPRFEREYSVRCEEVKEKGGESQEGLIIFKMVGKSYEGKTCNISMGGLCLISYRDLPINTILSAEIFTSARKKPFKAIGEFTWKKKIPGEKRYFAGMQFIHIEEKEEFQALLEKSEFATDGLKRVKLSIEK